MHKKILMNRHNNFSSEENNSEKFITPIFTPKDPPPHSIPTEEILQHVINIACLRSQTAQNLFHIKKYERQSVPTPRHHSKQLHNYVQKIVKQNSYKLFCKFPASSCQQRRMERKKRSQQASSSICKHSPTLPLSTRLTLATMLFAMGSFNSRLPVDQLVDIQGWT